MTNQKLRQATVLILFILISAIFLKMIWGLLLAVVMAAIFAGLTYPLYERILRRFKGRSSAAAAVTLLLVLLVVVTPLLVIGGIVVAQAVEVAQSAEPWAEDLLRRAEEPGFLERLPFWDQLAPYSDQITQKLGEAAAAVSSFLVNGVSAATQKTMGFLFSAFIMLYSMFFFLVQGPEIRDQVMGLFPLKQADKDLLLDKFVSVSRATLKGTLVIGIVQGGLAGLAFAVVGIEGALFWSTIMAVLSIVPGIGTALIWVPAVGYLFAVGRVTAAIGLLLWCALVVGTADNFLRPLLVGKDTEMPDLMVMLSTFGGLAMFGAVGILIGPVIGALFMAIWRIYGETFGDLLSSSEG